MRVDYILPHHCDLLDHSGASPYSLWTASIPLAYRGLGVGSAFIHLRDYSLHPSTYDHTPGTSLGHNTVSHVTWYRLALGFQLNLKMSQSTYT